MQNTDYVTRWREAVAPPLGITARGRSMLRSVTLHGASMAQMCPSTPFLRSIYCHYVFDDQVDVFERTIAQLKEIGTFVDTDSLLDMLCGRRPIPGPCFHLSFDDGFRNIYTNALPVLQKHDIPALFFVPSGLVGAGPELARSYCLQTTGYAGIIELVSWEELRQMQESGVEVGSHTRTHARFSSVSADTVRLREELRGSKVELEEHLGRECRFISWPYGTRHDADDVSIEGVAAAGYLACFGAFRGQIQPNRTDQMRIPRHHFEAQWPWTHVRYFAYGGGEK